MEMENGNPCSQCFAYSVYHSMAWVSEIMQKFEQKIIFINDDALWIDDEMQHGI